ncbi:hypothetical protein [Novosphingobium sp. BL-52-GroH]|uniref:hypothetical protein n=1 Tax=Novosphingobium sp. BL-52-GroH TaxID=3349877 RepID=UPI00384C70F7
MTAITTFRNDSISGAASRRSLLQVLAFGAISLPTAASRPETTLQPVFSLHEDDRTSLIRTKAGRALSRHRYKSAEIAFAPLEAGAFGSNTRVTLHQSGAVLILATSAYLLDVGFPDEWNASFLKQDITKALAYANATGLGHDCPNMAALSIILSPYWKWGYPHLIGDPPMDAGGFTPDRVRPLVRAMLDRVADVTGHRRPKGCRYPHDGAQA